MGRVFKYLGDEGVIEDEMKRVVILMFFILGMVEFLNFIRKNKDKFECIIILDLNLVFINWVLEVINFRDVFDKVFINLVVFDSNGFFIVENYYIYFCNRCLKNFCKNVVLVEFVDK